MVAAGTWNGTDLTSLTPNGGTPKVGTDPTTNVTGVKFDEGIPAGQTRYYYITVDGNYAQVLILRKLLGQVEFVKKSRWTPTWHLTSYC